MNPRHPPYLRQVICVSALGLAALPANQARALLAAPPHNLAPVLPPRRISAGHFLFRRDGVLGTSLELMVHTARPDEARICEQQVLGEIERLRRILSTYDPASEISRFRANASVAVSPELEEVFAAYRHWSEVTGGALNVHLAHVIQLWKDAARTGQLPDRAALLAAAHAPKAFNVDALGKGYIIDRAVAIARQTASEGLLNIGGDLRTWGDRSWLIGVADPRQPADNAPLLAQIELRDAAIATSGGYLRFFEIAGQRFSHVIDPRTQWATPPWVSATVSASDCLSANALSTAACVLGPHEGMQLALRQARACLMMDAAGGIHASPVFLAVAAPGGSNSSAPIPLAPIANLPSAVADKSSAPASPSSTAPSPGAKTTPAEPAPTGPWPRDFQVYFYLTLRNTSGGGAHHPYIAVWIEDEKHNVIRNLSIWGTDLKYLPELSNWWGEFGRAAEAANARYVQSITRATRADGQYAIVWDGKDDKGAPVPQGNYDLVVEINRENGNHIKQATTVRCGDQPLTLPMHPTAESLPATIHYVNKIPPAISQP